MKKPIELLGTSFDCLCGRHHEVPTKRLFYGSDALEHLPGFLNSIAEKQTYLILADQRTWKVAGSRVERNLKKTGATVQYLIIPDRGGDSPVTDDKTRDFLLENAPAADLYIAVGSGVINDLGKWIAYLKEKPYVSVATAASMNGYASANVSAAINGLKVLFHARACQAVFAVPEIIEQAPYVLTTSGLGDVLAKPVSSADWKLNQFLFDEYYCQFSVDLLKDLEPIYLNNPHQIKERDPSAMEALFKALFFSSVAMTITGTSSPASGGEHLISHTIDMLADRDGAKHDFHGRQVGVGSIFTAALYEKVFNIDKPDFEMIPGGINHDFWGSLAPVIEKEYQKKIPKLELAIEKLSDLKNWNDLRSILKQNLMPAAKLKKCLKTAGAAHRIKDIRYNNQNMETGFFLSILKNANQMRERFTILDLAILLGVVPDQLDQLVSDWILD
ncbi:sn-glycerol-1-phosphate dehydrogenase [bacterium]|nr:sn-glycerol-1-phosphate dehydrogenase [bacterium]